MADQDKAVVGNAAKKAGSSRTKATSSASMLGQRLVLVLVLLAAGAIRLALQEWKPDLSRQLQMRLELNDPSTSWRSVMKLHGRINSPPEQLITTESWAGRSVPTPMLLVILSPFMYKGSAIFFTVMDLVAALCLYHIASLRMRSPVAATVATPLQIRSRLSARHLLNSLSTNGLRKTPSPFLASAIYALNPLTTLTCLAKSGSTVTSTLLLLSTCAAMNGLALPCVLAAAVASAVSFHPVLVLPALLLLCVSQSRHWATHKGRRIGKRRKDSPWDWAMPLVWTVICFGGVATFSAGYLADAGDRSGERPYDWKSLLQVYQGFILLPSLSPSLSLWWYFFVEIFDHFRDFFLLVFNVHLAIWTIPICVRFRHDPLYALFLLLGIQSIFKPYPTAGDVALYLSLSTLFPAQSSYLRTPLVTVLLYAYATLLVPCFAHLFLTLGSANANFLYAAGLVGSLGGITGWIDWAWAGGRYLWELEREAGLQELSEEDRAERITVVAALQDGSEKVTRTVVQL